MSLNNAKHEETSLNHDRIEEVVNKAKQKTVSNMKEQNGGAIKDIGDSIKKKPRKNRRKLRQPLTVSIANQQNILAIDCEMVGVGKNGKKSALARVSVVDFEGNVVIDTFVKPDQVVTDYRTFVSGVTKESLVNARDFKSVQNEVRRILHGKYVIGHSVFFDFQALKFTHPRRLTRDTSLYEGFINRCPHPYRTPSLKQLAAIILNERIQEGEHDSIEDAKTAMKLYRKVEQEWEEWIELHGIDAAYKNRRMGCFRCGSLEHVVRECPVPSATGYYMRRQQKNNSKEIKIACI